MILFDEIDDYVTFGWNKMVLLCIKYIFFIGRGGRGGRNMNKPAPTAEELDAELDAYSKEMK